MMIPMLKYCYSFTNSYGLAILLLTLILKLILFPLTVKQTESMAGIKLIQPKMKELQAKHKDNPQMLQMKMMELYKENKVNPLGGCLPTLVQIPFFIAIFVSLSSPQFKALVNTEGVSAGFLWLKSLTLPDKLMILPLLVAASTYLSQLTMNPGGAKDDPQMKMFAYMPIFMFFIAMSMPSGVLLYWASSQLITGAQQYFLNKRFAKKNAISIQGKEKK